jgi:hypothetical protein
MLVGVRCVKTSSKERSGPAEVHDVYELGDSCASVRLEYAVPKSQP